MDAGRIRFHRTVLFLVSLAFVSVGSQAATFVVNTTDDRGGDSYLNDQICDTNHNPTANPAQPRSGICTLRAAIQQANHTPGLDTILIRVLNVHPRSGLPAITQPANVFSGFTRPVSINGFQIAGRFTSGLTVTGGGTTIKGIIVERFSGHGVYLSGGGNNTVQGNFIGTRPGATPATANSANGGVGIAIVGSSDNLIGGDDPRYRNIIAKNGRDGILVASGANNNRIHGNYIGTNDNGDAAMGNTESGIFITGNSNGTKVGGLGFVTGNVISANGIDGVIIQDSHDTIILQNKIGTDAHGDRALKNARIGVFIHHGDRTVIGGGAQRARNLISGNGSHGIQIQRSDTCTIEGNFIGVDITGRLRLGNEHNGIFLSNNKNCFIGGLSYSRRNIISANLQDGVAIAGAASENNTLVGNFIGVDKTADAALGNGNDGVFISRAPKNTVGGKTRDERNIIAANGDDGVQIQRQTASGNHVEGNYIGTDHTGLLAGFGNADDGVFINDAPNNIIGGRNEVAGNLVRGNTIAANGDDGIQVQGNLATDNKIQSNYIGLKQNGREALGNTEFGVLLNDAIRTLIGGKNDAANGVSFRNIISANKTGIQIEGSGHHNTISGNRIGTDESGTQDLGNQFDGIRINNSANNIIGGDSDGTRNLISGNGDEGVQIQRRGAIHNQVIGNYIGVQSGGVLPLPNDGEGVWLLNNPSKNRIGGVNAGEQNLIAMNKNNGVVISSGEKNLISRNAIFGNDKLGIDLNFDGVTPNDLNDPDLGANQRHNFPYVFADTSGGDFIDGGVINGLPNEQIRLEFFSLPGNLRDPSHFGEAEQFEGFGKLTTDANGNGAVRIRKTIAAGRFIAATATDRAGNTSEFSCIGSYIDIDIDSDNSNQRPDFAPQRDAAEDDIELSLGRNPPPGRIVLINNDDQDADGVVDFFDGFDMDNAAANIDDRNAREASFVRLRIQVPAPIDLRISRIRVSYNASDPAAATLVGGVRTLPAGRLRLWRQKGAVARNKAAIDQAPAGDFVPPKIYKASVFGLTNANRTRDYWVEAVRPSTGVGSDRIQVELDLDGDDHFDCADVVSLTALQVELLNPIDRNHDGNINDPEEVAAGVGSEFTFWDPANRFAGSQTTNAARLTIEARARIQPAGLAAQLRWRLFNGRDTADATGQLFQPAGTARRWDGNNLNEGAGLAPVFTLDRMPANNADFGLKTIRLQLLNPANPRQVLHTITQELEVFWPLLVNLGGPRRDANFAKSHPGPNLNSIPADTNGRPAGQRAPNWFFYWGQVVPNTAEARYAGTRIPGNFGVTPAGFWFPNGYAGRHDRLIIGEVAANIDMLGGRTDGIDAFDDTIQHELFHAINQLVNYTNAGFGLGIGGATLVANNHWSGRFGKPAVAPPAPPPPATMLPVPVRRYNHYRNLNGDGDFNDPGEDLDLDGDDIFNGAEPGTVEGLAGPAEPNNQNGRAANDWGNPGKNHNTIRFND